MFWMVLMGFFAAFGVLSALWVVLGGWVTGADGNAPILVCRAGTEAAVLRRRRWLRSLGLLPKTAVLLDLGYSCEEKNVLQEQFPEIEFCTLESLRADRQEE